MRFLAFVIAVALLPPVLYGTLMAQATVLVMFDEPSLSQLAAIAVFGVPTGLVAWMAWQLAGYAGSGQCRLSSAQ